MEREIRMGGKGRDENASGEKKGKERKGEGKVKEEGQAQLRPRDLCSPAEEGVLSVEVSGGDEVPGLEGVVGLGQEGHQGPHNLLLILITYNQSWAKLLW